MQSAYPLGRTMNMPLILNVIAFFMLLLLLTRTRKTDWSLAKKVLVGLCLGVAFGLVLHFGGVSKSMLKQSRLNFDKIEKCE